VDDGLQAKEGKSTQRSTKLVARFSQLTVNEYFQQHANATGLPVMTVMVDLFVVEIQVSGHVHLSNLFPV